MRPDTFKNLELNAGVFFQGFDWSNIKTGQEMKEAIKAFIAADKGVLGATRGGGTFECTPDIRNIEADGKRYEFIGSTVNDGWTVQLSTTLIEVTPENFALALMCAEIENPEDKPDVTIVKVRTAIDESDYKPNICWIGDLSSGAYILIELDNAMNTEGANFTFTDKGEGTLPVTFVAHQGDLENQDYAPFRIVYIGDLSSKSRLMNVSLKADGMEIVTPVLSAEAGDDLSLGSTTKTATTTKTANKK